jgi:16S rRNA (uracil1498-N3)-methyltransferase
MKLHRFIGEYDLSQGGLSVENAAFVSQLRNVLRLNAGDEIILADGRLNEAIVKITKFSKTSFEAEVLKAFRNTAEISGNIVLYCAVLKKTNFEIAVQKAVEVGVREIVPLLTSRTVKFNFMKDRLEKIILEAAEQSGRGIVPALYRPLDFIDAVKDARKSEFNVFLHPPVSDSFPCSEHPNNIGIFVGPEGGWTNEEVEMAKHGGFRFASLGPLTYRAETAATIGVYLASQCLRGKKDGGECQKCAAS